MNSEYWIPGRPATFATNQEKTWREQVKFQLKETTNKCNLLELEFVLCKDNMEKYAFDLDNLCEPIFAVLTSDLGWYEEKRANIQKWMASKIIGDSEGVYLRELENLKLIKEGEKPIFDGCFEGRLPSKATDVEIPNWLYKQVDLKPVSGICSVRIQFGKTDLSIATVNTGKIKPIIDCLYPILGGEIGAPADHLMSRLLVEKNISTIKKDTIRITVWD